MSDEPAPIMNQVSPEYRKQCLEMALGIASPGDNPGKIVEAAKAFYAYIHGEK